MKRHPILTGCVLIIGLAFITLVVVSVLSGPGSGGGSSFLADGKVAIVEIKGVIFDSQDILKELEEHRKDKSIKAVVIRIDSPGGGVAPSQEIYETVKRLDREKPVIASMGSVAASGGYYIAIGARKILANPGTITGSIGVILEIANVEGLMEWAKVRHEIIKTGPYKDIGSPFRSLTDDERKKLQEFADDIFDQFVTAVEKGRKLPREEVLKIADGMVFSGKKALDLGLVDKLGTLNDAITIAAREANIEGEPGIIYPSRPTFWRKLFESKISVIDGIIPWEGMRAMYLFRL